MGLLRKVALGFLVIGGTLVAARPSEAQFIGSSSGSNSRHAAPFSLGVGPGFGYGYGNGFGNAYGYGYGNAYGYNPYVNSGYGYTRYYVNPAMTYNNLNGVGGIIGQSTRTPGTTFRRRR
jgi:hypothetical protein